MKSDGCIQGVVSSISLRSKDSIIFNLKARDEQTYKIICNFFCPVQEQDSVYIAECALEDKENKVLRALTQPFASIPDDPEQIKAYFMKVLRGTNFGIVSASRLYEFIANLAKQFRYGKDFIGDDTDEELFGTVENYRYSGDGVAAFLTEMASRFEDSGSENILGLFVDKTALRAAQARILLKDWHHRRSYRKLYMLGLTKTEIQNSGMSIDELYTNCLENPYKIPSIDFEKCERILSSVRREVGDLEKLCGKVNRYIYKMIKEKDNTCIKYTFLEKNFPFIGEIKSYLEKDYNIIFDKSEKGLYNNVYITQTYKIENYVCKYVNNLILGSAEQIRKYEDFINSTKIQRFQCPTITEEQKTAINAALINKISIITGGAGTGKSLIIREITRNLAIRGVKFHVCAFTGKAVSKLHSVMENKTALTIDRLIIGIKKERCFKPEHLIIDEGSMVTTELFYRLLKIVGENIPITIVGDCNQLPPIGWGNMMRELINCQRIPTFYLTKNHRIEGAESGERYILENANLLIQPNRSLKTPIQFKEGEGFWIVNGSLPIIPMIVQKMKQTGILTDEILILSPTRKELFDLNSAVQNIYLGPEGENTNCFVQPVSGGIIKWHVKDRVMMTRNDYKNNIMNGEEGRIVDISSEGLKVQFMKSDESGEEVFIFKFNADAPKDKDDSSEDAKEDDSSELTTSDLIHSYAVTIHKSQGSESNYVILFIPDSIKGNFLNINLLYTAITRTKKKLWIVGSKDTLLQIANTKMIHKNDGLAKKLEELKNPEIEEVLKPYIIAPVFETSLTSDVGITYTFDDDMDYLALCAEDF